MTSEKKFVLIGHPVGHSLSPVIHQAAYQHFGVNHRYDLVDCPGRAEVEAVIARLRSGEIAGANVTVPHKRLAFELADTHHQSAQDTEVANVLSCGPEGEIVAFNTDAIALQRELAELWRGPEGRATNGPSSALIVGAGGAAQAAVVACRGLGVKRVLVCRRSWAEETPRAQWQRADTFEALGAQCIAWSEAGKHCRRVELVVQATSAGMQGAGPGHQVSDWIPWAELQESAVAYDVVYNPRWTPFLLAAEQAGVPAAGGLGMLVRQAAAAIEIWLGQLPPLSPLMEAAVQRLPRQDRRQ